MSLLEQLQQRAASRQGEKARKGAGLQMFVAQQEEIAEAVAAHWPLKEIHALLQEQDRMPVTYRVFCGYVYRFITTKEKNERVKSAQYDQHHEPAQQVRAAQDKSPIVADTGGQSGFSHTPDFRAGKNLI